MSASRIVFRQLKGAMSGVRARLSRIGYLLLQDCTDRNHTPSVGRLDLTAEAVLPWHREMRAALARAAGEEEPVEDEPSGELETSGSFYVDEDDAEAPALTQLSEEETLQAAFYWLRETAAGVMSPGQTRNFRVRAQGPKGQELVWSFYFTCTYKAGADLPAARGPHLPAVQAELPPPTPVPPRPAPAPEAPTLGLRIPTPTFEDGLSDEILLRMRSLGELYARWGQIVLGSVGEMQGVNNAVVNRLHSELTSSREYVDQLLAALLLMRHREADAIVETHVRTQQGDQKTTLVREAIQQIGQAGQMFLLSKGLPPDTVDTLNALGRNPAMLGLLQDPAVQAILRDPQEGPRVAEMLRGLAQQMHAARQAPPPGSAAPGDPQGGSSPA